MSIHTVASQTTRPLSPEMARDARSTTARPSEWSPAQLAYMRWLAAPTFARNPGSEAELARQLGRSVAALHLWRLRPTFRREVARLVESSHGGEIGELFACIEEQAAQGSAKHSQLYFDLLEAVGQSGEQPGGGTVQLEVRIGD
ncbi:MAG: hypothetical protein ACJ78Q_02035 [Chloroflexia bacterium]|jgi:hypothetical protein